MSAPSLLTRCRRPAIGWLQLLVVLFWIFIPAFRSSAIDVPADNGTPNWNVPNWGSPYWMALSGGTEAEPTGGPEWGDVGPDDLPNNVPDWYDQFQAAVNNSSLAWWPGGSQHYHDNNMVPYVVDGVAKTFPGQWHIANDSDWDNDGIPASLDKYPYDATNNSCWWPGGIAQINGNSYMARAQWFAGSSADSNSNGVPDGMEVALASSNAPVLFYWPGGSFLLNGQSSWVYSMYFYGYDPSNPDDDAGDKDGDGIPNALDPLPNDYWNNSYYYWEGGDWFINGLSTHFDPGYHAGFKVDSDGDGIPDELEPYRSDYYNNTAWWAGGAVWIEGTLQTLTGQYHAANFGDTDGDGIPDDLDPYPGDASNRTVAWQGDTFIIGGVFYQFPAQNVAANAMGSPLDSNYDGIPDTAVVSVAGIGAGFFWPPLDYSGTATTISFPMDADNHPVPFYSTAYYIPWVDTDNDGIPDVADPYPNDAYNGNDTDGDGVPDSVEMDIRYSRAVYDGNPYGLSPGDAADVNYPRYVWVASVNAWQTDGLTWKQACDHDRTQPGGDRWMDTLQDTVTDSDGDGMTDFYEVQNGLDLNIPNDAVDAPIGHLDPAVTTPVMNDFILNIEKARAGVPLATVITDSALYEQITGHSATILPAHDFAQSVAENDWDGDGVSNLDEIHFGTDPRDGTLRPTDAEIIAAYLACQLSATTIAYFYDSLFSGLDLNLDGIPDGIERTYGITPANADTVRSIGNSTDGLTWRQAYELGFLDQLMPSLQITGLPELLTVNLGDTGGFNASVSGGGGGHHVLYYGGRRASPRDDYAIL